MKKIVKKKYILLGLVIATAIVTGGCIKMEDIYKSKGDRAIEFVEEKYGIEFEPYLYQKADYLSSTDRVLCYAEGMDRENEHVEVTITKENGKVVYGDNYFGFWIRPQIEEYVSEMVEPEFEEFKLYGVEDVGNLPNELTCESTLEDLYRVSNDYWPFITIYVKVDEDISIEEYEEKVKRIENRLLESKHYYTLYVYVVGEKIYNAVSRYDQEEFTQFYVTHREPDGEVYYYVYQESIGHGEVL